MQRESFLFYRSFYNAIRLLGDKSRLKLYDSVMKLNFECDENVSNLEQLCTEIETKLKQNRTIYAQFLLIKPQIIANLIRYKNGCKGAEYGLLGGAPKGNKNACKNNPKTTPKEEGIRNKEEGIRNKDISFKKEKKEKSFQSFQNSADLPENLRECGIYGNNTLLEANKKETGEVFKPPKTTDPYINSELEGYFRLYEELCPNLPRLRYERRNAQIRELLARFIDEIDDDVGYFKSLCEKANDLKKICERQIDFKMLINNHIGIFNGKYENDSFDVMDLFKKKQE